MQRPLIRPATIGDIDAITTMLREIHAQHLAWDAERWTTREPPHTTYGAWIRELVSRPAEGIVLVAQVAGQVVGYTLAEVEPESTRHWSPRAVYVHDLFVVTRHRRSGIARALVESLFAWADTTHPRLQLRLMTAASNEAARTFFASYGFKPCVVEMVATREPR